MHDIKKSMKGALSGPKPDVITWKDPSGRVLDKH